MNQTDTLILVIGIENGHSVTDRILSLAQKMEDEINICSMASYDSIEATREKVHHALTSTPELTMQDFKDVYEHFKNECLVFGQKQESYEIKEIPRMRFPGKHIFGNIRGDFIVWAGKIVMHWNGWHGVWVFWQPLEVMKKRTEIFTKTIHRHLRLAENHGRRYDRKVRTQWV